MDPMARPGQQGGSLADRIRARNAAKVILKHLDFQYFWPSWSARREQRTGRGVEVWSGSRTSSERRRSLGRRRGRRRRPGRPATTEELQVSLEIAELKLRHIVNSFQTGLRKAKVPMMVYSCGGFSRCFRVCRFYDVEVRPGHFWGIRFDNDFTGSPSGRGIWSTHACDDKKSLKRFFLAEKGGKGDLAFKRKLQATVGSLCKIHNCWMNGKCWSILTWGARVPAYDMAAGAPQRHKSKRKLFRQLTRNVESQKCWKIEASWVGGLSICCDLKDCEEAGGSSYRQLMIHRHKVPCALTTLYIVHHYILHCTKWHTLL